MKDHLSSENIYEILLGICSDDDRAAFTCHLNECESCRTKLEESREILKHLEHLPVPECSEKRWNDLVRNALRQSAPGDLAQKEAKKPFFPFSVKWMWRFALIILVFVCGYLSGVSKGGMRISEKERSAPEEIKIAPTPVSIPPSSENKIPQNHVVIYALSPSDEDSAVLQTLRPVYTTEQNIKKNDATSTETVSNAIFQLI